jgi:S-DNA-T family DNA segregation ATPase FtsK/SpoIIIE
VDDYETILTSSGNPLNPLGDLLLHSRDIGFHLVVARSVGGSSRAYDQLLQRVKEMGSPGLIMSGEFQEGPLLGTQRATVLPPGRGYLVRRSQSTLIQVVLSEPESAQTVGQARDSKL